MIEDLRRAASPRGFDPVQPNTSDAPQLGIMRRPEPDKDWRALGEGLKPMMPIESRSGVIRAPTRIAKMAASTRGV